nr:hypothetical protein [Tanacetum cinerariifolium]
KALEKSKVSFSIPTGGIYGEVRVKSFRNAIGIHYLPYSREYVAPKSIDLDRHWFETIGYEETVSAKGTLKKSLLPLRVTSEEREDPQLSSSISAFNLNKPIYSASFIIHSESGSGNDALADSAAEVDLGKSALSDFIPQQQ